LSIMTVSLLALIRTETIAPIRHINSRVRGFTFTDDPSLSPEY
jgi:hypothetical protein